MLEYDTPVIRSIKKTDKKITNQQQEKREMRFFFTDMTKITEN